jgi:hypothetical protein
MVRKIKQCYPRGAAYLDIVLQMKVCFDIHDSNTLTLSSKSGDNGS